MTELITAIALLCQVHGSGFNVYEYQRKCQRELVLCVDADKSKPASVVLWECLKK